MYTNKTVWGHCCTPGPILPVPGMLVQSQLRAAGIIFAPESTSRVRVSPPSTRTPGRQQDPDEASKLWHTDRRQLRVHDAVY